jgi:putative endonuclease
LLITDFIKMVKEERQQRLKLGDRGEKVAANYLLAQGYEMVSANFSNDKGYRWGEIDLVVKNKRGQIIFVEVKTRQNNKSENNEDILPEENVTPQKIRKIEKAANVFLKENDLSGVDWRIDVVAIIFNNVSRKISLKHIKYIRI